MTLRLPENLLAEKVEMPPPEAPREVEAVPLREGELDPVLTRAVESQPEVGVSAGSRGNPGPEVKGKKSVEEAKNPKPAPAQAKPTLSGYAVALLGAALVVAAAALGMKGGTGAGPAPCGNCGGGAGGPAVSGGSGPVIY
ncbi:hypothetical protein [Thermus tengchongensis]|uniref:hypothetical protein n=1 Tax=Thermus tengchongensis TaxID=1214928 RepID=UPI001F358399|nr:hypothetical protein [Thermus tengchongensis]